MPNQFSRTQLVVGPTAMEDLKRAHVAVFGIGGVGGYVVEALARSGVGALDLIDHDRVCITNVNRQIVATTETIGQYKVDIMEQRVRAINPQCKVTTYKCFYLPSTKDQFDFRSYDYVVDAVDTVTAKLQLVMESHACNTPIICSMGAGNKLNPADFQVADISKTSVDPLAKIIRKELRKRGINHLKVVYSQERPQRPYMDLSGACAYREACPPEVREACDEPSGDAPGSVSFVPPVVGMILASEVVKDITADSRYSAALHL